MSAGVAESVYSMVSGRAIFTPIKLDKGINAAYFAGPDEVVASGYMWEENRKQIAAAYAAINILVGLLAPNHKPTTEEIAEGAAA